MGTGEAKEPEKGDVGMNTPPIVSLQEWQVARENLLVKEKAFTRARDALAAMARASPLSLKITFRQLQLGRGMNVEQALALEYRMTQHVMAGHDFFEGIRAALVDKDQRPRWQHATPADVTAAEVESYFANLGERELRFA